MEKTIGKIIKDLRREKNITQTELGNILGVAKTTISSYERDYSSPDLNTLKEIAKYFRVSTDYLLGNNAVAENPDEKDVGVTFEKLKKQLATSQGLMFNGEILDEETAILILEELERQEKIVKVINKKYIPKKYRKE